VEKKNLKEVKKLIDLGKEKGYLTYDDVNDMLPAEVVSPDQIDDVMSIFGELDIEVVDSSARVPIGGAGDELVDEEEDEKEVDSDGDMVGKTGDPVRMYLREMGTVSLLSREGEVEIAKKIEQGENQVINEVLSSPLALTHVLGLGDKLAEHEIRVREIIKEEGEEENEYLEDEEVHEKRLLEQIGKIRRTFNEREKLNKQLDGKRVSVRRRQVLSLGVAKQQDKIINGLKSLQLNRKQTEAIADGLKVAMDRMQTLERRVQDFESRTGKTGPEILKLVAGMNGRRKDWQRLIGSLRMSQDGGGDQDSAPRHPAYRKGHATAGGRDQTARMVDHRRGDQSQFGQKGVDRSQPPTGGQHRQKIHQPRAAVSRPDPGRQYRLDESRG